MKALLLPFLFSYVHAFNEACAFTYGQWVPEPGQCFALVMRELGINRQQIEDLNPSVDLDEIFPSVAYNVPYRVPRYSAVWISGCPPMLQLSGGAGYPNSLVCGHRQSMTSQPPSSTAKAKATPSSRYSSDGGSTTTDATSTSVSRRPALSSPSLSAVQSRHEGKKKHPSDTSSRQELLTSSTTPLVGEESTPLGVPSKDTIQPSRTASITPSSEDTSSTLRPMPAVGTAAASIDLLSMDSSEPCATRASTRTTATSVTLPAEDNSRKSPSSRSGTAQETSPSSKDTPTTRSRTSTEKLATSSPDMPSSARTSAATNTETTRAIEASTSQATSPVTALSTASMDDRDRESLMELIKTLLTENLSRPSATASSWKNHENRKTSDAQLTTISTNRKSSEAATTTVSSAMETKRSSVTIHQSEHNDETTTTASSHSSSIAKTTSSTTRSSSFYSKNQKTTLHRTKSAPPKKATATTADLSQTSLPPPVCGDEAELPGHGDIKKSRVETTAGKWCTDGRYQTLIGPKDKCSLGVEWLGEVGHEYSICWAEGCVGEVQYRENPLGKDGPSCKDIMLKNWSLCTGNGGVGGVTQVGCLLYKFRGGVGKLQGYGEDKKYKPGGKYKRGLRQ